MKRNFKFMAAKLTKSAGVLCACALMVAPVTSCTKGLEDGLADLQTQVDGLSQKVAELEKKLSEQISALDKIVKEQITVSSVNFDEATGKYVILLSDKTTIEVNKSTGKVPMIGIEKDEKGAYYWTLDGKPILTPSGDKLYSAPSLRVNSATGFWEVSADGGATYISTGIKANANASIVSKVDEDDTYVYFTLADGSKIRVSKTVDFSIMPLSGKQYFTAGQKREVKLALSGVKKSAVFSKPDGWKASISGDVLTIRAPKADNTTADKYGKVIVQAWFNDGTSDIMEVSVKMGVAPHEFEIEPSMDIHISIDPALVDDYNFEGSAVGAIALSEFSEEKVLAMYEEYDRWMWPDAFPFHTTLKELLGKEPVKGETYIIYTVSSTWMQGKEIVYTAATVPDVKISVSDITFENAMLSVQVKGFDEYFGGVRPDEPSWDLAVLSDVMNGWAISDNKSYQGPLDGFCADAFNAVDLKPGSKWIVYVLPKVKPADEYGPADVKNFITYKVTINDVAFGGNASVEVSNVEVTMTSVKATVTKKPNAYKYWARYYREDRLSKLNTDQLLLADLMNRKALDKETYELKEERLNPGQRGTIVAVGIDKDGKVGQFVRKDVVTTALSFSTTAIQAPKVKAGVVDAVVNIPATSGIKRYKYIDMSYKEWPNHFQFKGQIENAENYLALQNASNHLCTVVDANPDGSAEFTISNLTPGQRRILVVIGEDADGKPTRGKDVKYTPNIQAYIDNTMSNYKDLTINSVTLDGTDVRQMNKAEYDALEVVRIEVVVTPPANCKSIVFVAGTTPDEVKAGANPVASEKGRDVTAWLLSHYSKSVYEVSGSSVVCSYDFFNNASRGYLVWQDNDGNYYQYQEVAPETMLSDASAN